MTKADINLLTGPVYPFVLDDGSRRWVSFPDLGGTEDGRRLSRPDTGDRALDCAVLEAFIAFAQLTLAPEGNSAWGKLVRQGVSRARILKACEPWEERFWLYRSSAFQARGGSGWKEDSISRALIDGISESAEKKNADIGGRDIAGIDLRITAIAIQHLARHAPAGGAGYRTSLSGGGPLRTIVEMGGQDGGRDFAATIYANVLPEDAFASLGTESREDRDPLTWDDAREGALTSGNASSAYLYWGLARGLRLDAPQGAGICDLSAQRTEHLVRSIQVTPKAGAEFSSSGWRHPLSAYAGGAKRPVFPIRAQSFPPEFGWKERVGIFQASGSHDSTWREPAIVVARARRYGLKNWSIHAFGHSADKATIEGWTEGRRAFRDIEGGDEARASFDRTAEATVSHAMRMQRALAIAVTRAAGVRIEQKASRAPRKNDESDGVRAVKTSAVSASNAFWLRTERAWAHLEDRILRPDPRSGLVAAREGFHRAAAHEAESIWCDMFGADLLSDPLRHAPIHSALRKSLHSRAARANFIGTDG